MTIIGELNLKGSVMSAPASLSRPMMREAEIGIIDAHWTRALDTLLLTSAPGSAASAPSHIG